MNEVELKNGSREVSQLIAVTMASLNRLLRDGLAIVVYELVELCRDPKHKPWGQTGDDLKAVGLATCSNGEWRVHNSIRNIVLSATSGEGLNIVVSDPRTTEPPAPTPGGDSSDGTGGRKPD